MANVNFKNLLSRHEGWDMWHGKGEVGLTWKLKK